jgi:peroxiredoxin
MKMPYLFRDRSFAVAVVIVGISAALNVALAARVLSLTSPHAASRHQPQLTLGATVPPLSGKDEAGSPVSVNFAEARAGTLIYSFAVNCGWCARNVMNIKALTADTAMSYRVVGLTRGPLALQKGVLQKYKSDNQLPFPVLAGVSNSVLAAYKLGGTPQTILVSPEGKVVKVWSGAYTGVVQHDVEEFFKIKLPGLVAPSKGLNLHGSLP